MRYLRSECAKPFACSSAIVALKLVRAASVRTTSATDRRQASSVTQRGRRTPSVRAALERNADWTPAASVRIWGMTVARRLVEPATRA